MIDWFWHALHGGLGNLAAYLAAHVLLCLLPAFFIAGAMSALIPKASVTRFLGRDAPGYVAYPAAASAGSLLAVCSCTIIPLFAGIYKKGAGLGPAITFLFFAPAANILALVYTGGVIGVDLALARFILSLAFGIAAIATVALISAYAGWTFKSRGQGIRALVAFTFLYGLLYVLMRLEDYALLAGALASIPAIAAVMWFTRNIDWYGGKGNANTVS